MTDAATKMSVYRMQNANRKTSGVARVRVALLLFLLLVSDVFVLQEFVCASFGGDSFLGEEVGAMRYYVP